MPKSKSFLAALVVSALASFALLLPLGLWRALYPVADWAVLVLALLTLLLFVSRRRPDLRASRARIDAVFRPGSPIGRLLTGRLGANFRATLFILICVPALAWQALSATSVEIYGLIALSCFAGFITLFIHSWADWHLRAPYAPRAALTVGSLLAALIGVPLLAWANWSFAFHPGAFRALGFEEAISLGLQDLPPRRGWIAEILSVFYALDATKLWLAVQMGSSRWAAALFSLDTALIAFLAARASAGVALLFWSKFEKDAKA